MVLTKMGYSVSAVTGKDSKSDYLKSLGAKNIINRAEFDKDPRPIDKGLWDGVVDTVGGKILANAIAQTKSNGIIAVCGNANSNELNTNLLPFMLRGIKVWGMDSANCSRIMGEVFFGGFSQIAKVSGDFLVKKPESLTSKQAMIYLNSLLKRRSRRSVTKV